MTRQEIERHDSYLTLRKQGVSWAEIGYGGSISADAARCWFNRTRNAMIKQNMYMEPRGYAYSQQLESHLVKEYADPEKEPAYVCMGDQNSGSLPYEDLSFSEVEKIMKEEYQVDFTSTRPNDVVDTFENAPKNESEVQVWTGQQYEEKKEPYVSWRDHFRLAEEQKRLQRLASGNNTFLKVDYSNDNELHFICLGDLHLFAGGTDHAAIERITDRIMAHSNLRVVLLGDILEMAINMRSAAEVGSQRANSAIQLKVLEAWMDEIKGRVLFSTHDNHSSERLEKAAGVDFYGWIMSKTCPFFDGIGVANMLVGNQEYKIGATHKVRGKSISNPTHGQSRYMRFDDQSLDAMLAGDSHQPGISQYWDGDRERLAVNVGTMNTQSAYAKRYFSLYSQPIFPVVTLYGAQKEMNAFRSLESWALAHGNK